MITNRQIIQNEEYIKQFNDLTDEINQQIIGSAEYRTLSRKRDKLTKQYKNWLKFRGTMINRFKEIMKSLNEYMDELSKEGDYTLEYTKHKFSLYKQDYVGNYDVMSTLVDEYPAHRCFDATESTHLKDHANIGKCLLACIHTYEHERHFNLECFDEKFMLEFVCKLFGLNVKEELKNYGYEVEE